MHNKLKFFITLILSFQLFLSCKGKDPDLEPESGISIELYNPNPLPVDLNSYIPSIKGIVKSTKPIQSLILYAVENTSETKIAEINASSGFEAEFDFDISIKTTFKSLKLKAINNNNQEKSASIILSLAQLPPAQAVPIGNTDAFPGAEGHGRYTTGGRGGKILYVDNLNDDNKQGSLRWAINQEGARTIVFRVAGIIQLSSPLIIANGNLTIAGQSAPGKGICIARNTVQLKDGIQNVIIRYLRFRCSAGLGEYDAAWGRNGTNIIIDHCSFSWGNDEVASFYDNKDFTMQWCIISESFYQSTHPKGNHGYGGIWGGMNASFHHNLIAHHTSRNPRFCGARYHIDTRESEIVDFRNNVIYNWGTNSAYGGEYGQQNMVNNYFKSGPATSSAKKNRIVEITSEDSKWYIDGNYVHGYPAISSSNWSGGVQGANTNPATRSLTPFPSGNIVTQTAEAAFEEVLNKAGASLSRDAIDTRICNETQNGTTTYSGVYGPGIIDSELNVGGFPIYSSSNKIIDYDNDGMPDQWEIQKGLDPKNPNDHKDYKLSQVFTNLEIYLNEVLNSAK
jgi:hypothetical protein